MNKDLKSKEFNELERLVAGLGERKYLAGYIFGFIHTRGVRDICEITPLSKSFRSKLVEQGYFISSLTVVEKLTDPDGTVKYVFGLPDGNKIESVLLFDDDRLTLCVSTQVGCAMGCVFCATGRLGLSRNPARPAGGLTAGEIVDQVNIIADCRLQIADCKIRNPTRSEAQSPFRKSEIQNRITNVVFMGMGEPLANYDSTLSAVRILNHPKGRNIGIRHLTISTCGLAEGIERLADEFRRAGTPRLAISLNAPTDAIRRRLMPIAKKEPFDRLFKAVGLYQRKTHNRVTFEYCMIKGVNDTALHARMLVKLLCPYVCNVNLIEFNPHKGCNLQPSGKEAIERFAMVLKEAGLETTVRRSFGQTINAACGQLGASAGCEITNTKSDT